MNEYVVHPPYFPERTKQKTNKQIAKLEAKLEAVQSTNQQLLTMMTAFMQSQSMTPRSKEKHISDATLESQRNKQKSKKAKALEARSNKQLKTPAKKIECLLWTVPYLHYLPIQV